MEIWSTMPAILGDKLAVGGGGGVDEAAEGVGSAREQEEEAKVRRAIALQRDSISKVLSYCLYSNTSGESSNLPRGSGDAGEVLGEAAETGLLQGRARSAGRSAASSSASRTAMAKIEVRGGGRELRSKRAGDSKGETRDRAQSRVQLSALLARGWLHLEESSEILRTGTPSLASSSAAGLAEAGCTALHRDRRVVA